MDIKRIAELAGISTLLETEKKEEIKKEEDSKQDSTQVQQTTEPQKQEDEEQPQPSVTPVVTSPVVTSPVVATPPVPVGGQTDVQQTPQSQPVTASPPQMSSTEVVKMFLGMRDQIHYYHLQTESYAEHKALNDFYDTILDIADKFLESYQGIFGRAQGEVSVTLKNYSSDGVRNDVKQFSETVKKLQEQVKSNTDLVNLLDELLNACNKTLYLLTLK